MKQPGPRLKENFSQLHKDRDKLRFIPVNLENLSNEKRAIAPPVEVYGVSVSLRRAGYCWRIQSRLRKLFKFDRIKRISSLFGEFANSIGLSGHAYNKPLKAHQKAYGERGYGPHAQAANSMSMGLIRERAQFDFMPLSERPDAIPQVARWWCDEWGLPQRHESMESYLSELASLKPGKLPIHLLALSERNIVGVATLKDQSALHKLFPDFQYWLSGVYVPPALRSRGIATALCLKMVDIAKTRGVTRLHLVTEVLDGGLYAKIGWNPIRQVHVDDLDLLVMARDVP